ncbi:MAG: radical SAM protein [Candidatus Woesearchaeota archaeon]
MAKKSKNLIINYKCNSNCYLCNFPVQNNKKENFISFEKLTDEINNINFYNFNEINIYGADPFIHKNIFEILKLIPEDIKLNIFTNTRALSYKNYCFKLKNFKNLNVFVKVYSNNSKLHNFITQTSNSFEQTLKGIKNLFFYKIKFSIIIDVCEQNFVFLNEIIDFFNSFRPKKIIIKPILPIGKAKDDYFKFALRYSEIIDVLKINYDNIYGFFPLCFLNDRKINFFNLDYLNYEKSKNNKCIKCKFFQKCIGMPEDYVDLFGAEELLG